MSEKQGSTKYKPGQSGNPKGRPKKEVCITSWLKEYAAKLISDPIDPKTLTYAQAAAYSLWKAAAKGNLPEYTFIVERCEGKLVQGVDMTSKGDAIKAPTTIQVVDIETKNLLTRVQNGERTQLENNQNIQGQPASLPVGQAPNPE